MKIKLNNPAWEAGRNSFLRVSKTNKTRWREKIKRFLTKEASEAYEVSEAYEALKSAGSMKSTGSIKKHEKHWKR
jgi:hypothetical protein